MKIIAVDNFNRDNVADRLIAENVPSFYVKTLVDALNAQFCNHDGAPWFFCGVDNDHPLMEVDY